MRSPKSPNGFVPQVILKLGGSHQWMGSGASVRATAALKLKARSKGSVSAYRQELGQAYAKEQAEHDRARTHTRGRNGRKKEGAASYPTTLVLCRIGLLIIAFVHARNGIFYVAILSLLVNRGSPLHDHVPVFCQQSLMRCHSAGAT